MSLANAIVNQNQYILAPSLQMFFINPADGRPLTAGIITFYKDTDRTITGLKPVYRIGGTPAAPTFTPLPNPITLDQFGIFIDPNNQDEILPYYNVLGADGEIEQYYITIQDQFGATIETLEHFPSVTAGGEPIVNQTTNFIPNGQFLLHLNLPAAGLISQASTPIAYGNWQFNITYPSTSVNFVTFERYAAPIDNPESNPRYSVRVRCTVANPADSQKDLTNLITDVNFLQGQTVSFGMTAYSRDGNNHNVQLIIKKVYGQTGVFSPPTEDVIATFTITPQIQTFNQIFTMSSNIGKTMGPFNNDNLQIILRAPLDTVSDINYTDILGVEGSFGVLVYPNITPQQTKVQTFPASFVTPAYDGSDFGKFVQIDYTFQDSSEIGFVYADPFTAFPTGTHLAYIGATPPAGFLLEDGASYAVNTGGSIGAQIPLFNVILANSTLGTYEYGSGMNGFTYATVFPPFPALPTNQLYVVWNRYDIVQPAPNPGTSGFTFTFDQAVNPNVNQQVYTETVLPGSSIVAGSYYTLPVNTTGPQFIQLFWFTVNGVGTIPAITHDVAVQINVLSTDTAAQVATNIMQNANGLFQVPDLRNFLIRYWNNGSFHTGTDNNPALRNPSQDNQATVIAPAYISYITGNSGDNIGSSQQNLLLTPGANPGFNGVAGDIYFNAIIKY